MIAKPINSSASSTNHLKLTEGNNLCCGDADRYHYTSAVIATGTDGTTLSVNVTDGTTTSTVALTGGPIDWNDPTNDDALIQAIGEVATDLNYEWLGGDIELIRDVDDLTILIKDSTLVWNWIGEATTGEVAFTQTTPY